MEAGVGGSRIVKFSCRTSCIVMMQVSHYRSNQHERHCFDTKFLWLTWKKESTSTGFLSGAAFHKLLEDCSLSDSECPGSRIATSV